MAGRRAILGGLFLSCALLLLSLILPGFHLQAQEFSGTWESKLEIVPQTTSAQVSPFDFALESQLDWGLDYEGLGFDNTLSFSNLGLTLIWLGWKATFPSAETGAAALKRTLAKNDYVKVMRSFPSEVSPGEVFEVTITIEALIDGIGAVTVTETLPRGWYLEPIAPLGDELGRNSRSYTFTFNLAGERETIRYLGYVPEGAPQRSYPIEGRVHSEVGLFPDLDFSDFLTVRARKPGIPAQVKMSQDLIFYPLIRNDQVTDPMAFRMMFLDAFINLPGGLGLTNYLSLYNVGTAQTPSLRWRDLIVLSGETARGVRVKLSTRFSSDGGLHFDRSAIRVISIPFDDLNLEGTAEVDDSGLNRVRLRVDHSRELGEMKLNLRSYLEFDDQLRTKLSSLNVALSSIIDGKLTITSYYGTLKYDEDTTGGPSAETEHFERTRCTVGISTSFDKLSIYSRSTFRPILEDIDGDGWREKAVPLQFTREDLRIRRVLKNMRFEGRFTWEAPKAGDPLRLTTVRFTGSLVFQGIRFIITAIHGVVDHSFKGTLRMIINF